MADDIKRKLNQIRIELNHWNKDYDRPVLFIQHDEENEATAMLLNPGEAVQTASGVMTYERARVLATGTLMKRQVQLQTQVLAEEPGFDIGKFFAEQNEQK